MGSLRKEVSRLDTLKLIFAIGAEEFEVTGKRRRIAAYINDTLWFHLAECLNHRAVTAFARRI
jgi:hypothetical protein